MSDYIVALIGNPNAGKTTLFNVLTRSHQKVGNWPGVTVEKKSGTFMLEKETVELVDLPGIYSLEQDYMGMDEEIARDFLESETLDLIINIVDASNLERNLILTQQLLDRNVPVIVVLNMLDVARQQGEEIDAPTLEQRLGVPVAPMVAARSTGIEHLRAHIILELLENPNHGANRLAATERGSSASDTLMRRWQKSKTLTDGVVEVLPTRHHLTEKIDNWVLNRYLGIPIFLLMMYLMFTLAINLGAVFIDFFDILFGAVLVDGFGWLLASLSMPDWVIVLLADGLGGGIQLVATFIPVIGFLYLCLSFLEDSGYMSRAAFVVDRLMSKLGLPGNAFVPLIVGFGCNVPAVMAARSLSRESDRLMTVAMAPFMSCGARLTVYALFAAAFFPVNGQNIVFLLYLLGIAMAVGTGFVFRKQIFTGEITSSFQEMPAYHVPVLRNIFLTTWFRLKSFIFRAGKTIVAVVVVLSFLNSIGSDGSFGNQDSEASVLSVIGKKITPLFKPMGLREENWPATVGLFTGLFAKEAVVGTLDALYTRSDDEADSSTPDVLGAVAEAVGSIGTNSLDLLDNLGDPLGLNLGEFSDTEGAAAAQGVSASTLSNMSTLFGSTFAAFCYLVFILLYAPCVAVLGAISKESGWRWMVLVFSWTTGLAYITATGIYQAGMLLDTPVFSSVWIICCGLLLVLAVVNLKKVGRKALPTSLIPVTQI